MTDYNDLIKSALRQYSTTQEKLSSNSNYKKKSKKDYFSTNLPKDENEATLYFRILPPKGGDIFTQANFHEVPVGDYGYMKLYDPAQDGEESPLNELRQKYLQSEDKSDKEEAKKYNTRTFYIVKGVEKDAKGNVVDNQVKFWRFKHNFNAEGPMDKIDAIFKDFFEREKTPIIHPTEGRDLIITVVRQKMKNSDKTYSKVTSIRTDDPSPICKDKELMEQLLNDETTWEDVYKKYPIDYLRIVADGETPTYDKEKGRYVAKDSNNSYNDRPKKGESVSLSDAYSGDESNEDDDMVTNEVPESSQTHNTSNQSNQNSYDGDESDDIDDDDLPF